ncbi:S9 family peptidase [Ensifer sp. NM-2]|uniref:prolyl oligopeptidase family serine peptidase n=1 Tax=Ensifer sp. NM-2 TaxID=2109730 RepID=UPI000D124846|nr:prolyl oligopeptidase family serine peptidase [Ensifer sp. NM-2]PSS60648.1 S9 family peptidase [Ensifer sp. NM-2]
MPDIVYPHTERVDVAEEHFGQAIIDPYRWLENSAAVDARVAAWIQAQNEITRAYLETLPGRDLLRQRMGELLDYARFTAPVKRGGRYFFTLHEGPKNQPSLYMRDSVDGENCLLMDPNSWSEDGADALGEWEASDDGRLVAFGVQTGGEDWRRIKVLEVEDGKVLDDEIRWARFTRIAWAPDGTGFFYSRFPEPEAGKAAIAGVANQAVYFHRLGTSQANDRLIYSTPDRPHLLHMADRLANGRYLHIISTPGSNEAALTVVDLGSKHWTPRTIVPDLKSEWTVFGNDGTRLILTTTYGAECRRVVSLDLAETEPQPTEIVAEAEGKAVLNDAAILGGRLLVAYLRDAKTEIRRFTLDGKEDGIVELPGIGSAGGFRGNQEEDEAFFVFTSLNAPTSIYRYDVATGTVTPWAEPLVPVDVERFVVEQRFYRSKDDTKVPIFVMRRKDVASPAPTLLYGYGGFGISQIPCYNPLQLAWVEQGGVLAVANIRGGGEYGRAWHRAGKLENKQNAFDDFIAAGEFLKQAGIALHDGLAIQGESGGGLLVGAVTNQRPELFDVALPGVGVMDMLRYEKFTGGMLWAGEFGSPAEEAHFHNLMSYSPYHTIKPGRNYPAILATTADADDRVVPAHTFKYVAALQAADLGPRPHLVRIETRAGHGAGMPLDKVIAHHADMWAFAAYWTGLKITSTR